MRSKTLLIVLAGGLALTAAGCDKVQQKIKGQPGGQVVATVGGDEITALELRNELGGFNSPDPKIMKLAQDQALQQIIIRDLLAQRAKQQKLDKLPQYSLQVRRGERTLLAQMYESKLFANVAPPTRQEAENFVANNPDKFAQRRIYLVDRIVAPAGKIDKAKIPALKTLDEVKAMLDSQGIVYQTSVDVIDTLDAAPELIKGIDKLPAGEVFVFPRPNVYIFNRVFDTRPAPFRGELATNYATDELRKRQAMDFVSTQVTGIRRAAESQITYAKGYKPANADMPVAPVTGAPGAPAAPQGGQNPAKVEGEAPPAAAPAPK